MIPGRIRIKKVRNPNISHDEIESDIKEIPGVVHLWYVHNSNKFDMLADIAVQSPEEFKRIQSIIKTKPYVKDIESQLAITAGGNTPS